MKLWCYLSSIQPLWLGKRWSSFRISIPRDFWAALWLSTCDHLTRKMMDRELQAETLPGSTEITAVNASQRVPESLSLEGWSLGWVKTKSYQWMSVGVGKQSTLVFPLEKAEESVTAKGYCCVAFDLIDNQWLFLKYSPLGWFPFKFERVSFGSEVFVFVFPSSWDGEGRVWPYRCWEYKSATA